MEFLLKNFHVETFDFGLKFEFLSIYGEFYFDKKLNKKEFSKYLFNKPISETKIQFLPNFRSFQKTLTCIILLLPIGSINKPDVKLPNGTHNKFMDPIHEISSAFNTKSGCDVKLPPLYCRPGIRIVGYPRIKPHP